MNCPHTATADPNAFLLWPDASAATEEMMVWAQAAGYAEPGLTVGDFSLDDLDATLAWGQGGTTPAEAFGFQNYSVSIFTLACEKPYICHRIPIGCSEGRQPWACPVMASLFRMPRRSRQLSLPTSLTTPMHTLKEFPFASLVHRVSHHRNSPFFFSSHRSRSPHGCHLTPISSER